MNLSHISFSSLGIRTQARPLRRNPIRMAPIQRVLIQEALEQNFSNEKLKGCLDALNDLRAYLEKSYRQAMINKMRRICFDRRRELLDAIMDETKDFAYRTQSSYFEGQYHAYQQIKKKITN